MLCRVSTSFAFKEVLDLLPSPWEEFFMPGLDSRSFPGNCLDQPINSYDVIVEKNVPSPYVDLELVRRTDGGYLSLLTPNTRSQVRRSYRQYELMGVVTSEVARDLNRAMNIYDEMLKLHQKTWQARGKSGAFANPYFDHCHRQLIHKRFNQGEIQLFRVSCGQETIACLYNFVLGGKVHFYQSGINYGPDPRLKPGLISHVEAIKYNAEVGHDVYDFLGGDARYKSQLSTKCERLIWARIQKPRVKFYIERGLRSVKRDIQQRVKAKDYSKNRQEKR